jgi:hypothetical protein
MPKRQKDAQRLTGGSTSYRDLLDTAETIVDMEGSMEQVEAKLTRAGRNCNSRTMERITANTRRVKSAAHADADAAKYAFASQLAVLRNCPVVVSRLLKGEGSHLLVAKVLVLSRQLHSALSQSSSPAQTPPIVDQLRDRIVSARRKLLRRIDKRLANPACDAPALVETMCAYALATSDTPTQVLRHFHKIRLESVVSLLDRGHDELAKNGTAALRLCIQTCQDTQTVFPRRLADSLAKLKARPLVQDTDVRGLYELNLHVHDRWFADKTRDYTPQPRHDELQRADADKILHQWSKQAIAAFLRGIKSALADEHRLEEVATLRQELVETWILAGARMAGVKSSNVLDDLRDTINGHLESIVQSRAQNLKGAVSHVSRTLGAWSTTTPFSSLALWDKVPRSADLGHGAVAFKSTILNTHQGRDELVSDIAASFDAWMSSVLEVKAVVKSMKDARWDDTFADDIDDSDDEDISDTRRALLSDDDPALLEEVTQTALAKALQDLGNAVSRIVKELTTGDRQVEAQQICFLLRVMREISVKVPALKLQDRATPPTTPFTMDVLRPLYTALAQELVQPATTAYEKSLKYALKTTSTSHILWEGQPPLPAQPSPSAYRYLQNLTKTMARYGSDLWAPACVSVLKELACRTVTGVLKGSLDETANSTDTPELADRDDAADPADPADRNVTGDGAEAQSAGDSERTAVTPSRINAETRERHIKQAVFDALYLQRFVGNNSQDDPVDQLLENLKEFDGHNMPRLKKNAADYAKKTYLVFALLA